MAWCTYAMMQGDKEAVMYHVKDPNKSVGYNEHIIFTIERAAVLLMFFLLTDYIYAISAILWFPFLHDGMYYTARNELNPDIYKEKFFAQSSTSTAWSTKFFTPVVRSILFVIGLAVFTLHKMELI